MKTLCTTMLAIMCLIGGCGDTHESAARELISVSNEMAALLDGIQNETDAKAAVPRLKDVIARMKAIEARRQKLPMPDWSQFHQLEQVAQDLSASRLKVVNAIERIKPRPDLTKHIDEVMRSLLED